MTVLKFVFEHFWGTVCLILVIAFAVSAIIAAARGKNFW